MSPAKSGARFVALLRGINVGGKNMLPMKDLVALFEKAGCGDVSHYIQSGNVVFTAKPAAVKTLADAVSQQIERRFQLTVPVVIRTREELGAVVAANPFLKAGHELERLHVVFLRDRPTAGLAALLDPNRSPGDSFHWSGGEIFLSVAHAAKTKFTNAWMDSKLKTISTGRNWRTVLKLQEMLEAG